MNITQVYLTPEYDDADVKVRYRYQVQTNYIQLLIEECLRNNKRDLGAFNRIVLSEGGDETEDFDIVGNNALSISITRNFEGLDPLSTDREFHNYYVGKFLEGFRKFDSHFSTSLALYLEPLIDENYKDDLFYEKKMAAKRLERFRLQAMGRYSKNVFELIINVYEGNKLTNSRVVYESDPDMFTVKYHVNKVEIADNAVCIVNKLGEKTVVLEIADIT